MNLRTQLTVQRSLAAIMFADMVGYSALMQGDERSAYRARLRFRRSLEAATQRFGGEVVQHYGDGALILFKSAVNASRAAIHMQRALRTKPDVPVRVGIHMADVVRNADGVYGNGVNIAARIEAMGIPGSVMISGRVAGELTNQPALVAKDLGVHALKNIEEPVSIFALVHEALATPSEKDLPAPVPAPVTPAESPTVSQAPVRSAGSGIASLLYECHRRRVFKVVAGYIVAVVGVLTVLDYLTPLIPAARSVGHVALAVGLLGLPLTVYLAWVYDLTPTGILRTDPTRIGKIGGLVASGLIVGSVVLASAVSLVDVASQTQPTAEVQTTHGAVVVMPLAAIGSDDLHFSKSLQESLSTRLSEVAILPVLLKAATYSPDDSRADRIRSARASGASLAVEGCLQRFGARIRVQVRILDTNTGRRVWTARFEGDYNATASVEMQARIAAQVSEAVVSISGVGPPVPELHQTASLGP